MSATSVLETFLREPAVDKRSALVFSALFKMPLKCATNSIDMASVVMLRRTMGSKIFASCKPKARPKGKGKAKGKAKIPQVEEVVSGTFSAL